MRSILLLLPSFVAIAITTLTACPPSDQNNKKTNESPTGTGGPCTKIGQSCEVSPGKLGTCVQKDDCPQGTTCFNCQSQH